MFTKPVHEITFEDVQAFCQEWTEGVRVEYKQEINVKKHIPKVVSSFANTLGGTLIIGVECDRQKNEVISIDGIPPENGFEERILETALTHIYPAVIPAVKILEIPDSDNMVVVVHVDESVQAPHTIQNKEEVYIRSGSISRPYKRADIDRIEYMFKRRTDSQVVAKQILDRIEERTSYLFRKVMRPNDPTLTISVQPIFPYRPIISPSIIYKLYYSPKNNPPRRVSGGIFYLRDNEYFEFNEYGIVSRSVILPVRDKSKRQIRFGDFLEEMNNYLGSIKEFYHHSEYLGDIEVKMRLQNVLGYNMDDLIYNGVRIAPYLPHGVECSESEVVTETRCLSRNLENRVKRIDIVEELIGKILWSFDVPTDDERVRDLVRRRIDEGIR